MTHDELEQRLRDLGRQPVDGEVADRHLAAMASVRRPRRPRFGWRAVALAGGVGFFAGSTGLAAAGTLPDRAQDVAHDVLGAVGIDVPRSSEGCPEGKTYRNHGQYVSEVDAAGGGADAAAHSRCGKPEHGNSGNKPAAGEPRVDADGDPCTGPPPWAGTHLSTDQRAHLQAERQQQCGSDDVEDTP